ncbi:MAG: D-alanyl-D-alanine carboxypeptidase/D-alanyl-D-alanine-endopeptidase [Rhodocyclales bacterium]|nr:D-alanyl-D-alanine carboxypeptidase/D-alanyl-D-alanine-endopeptidase [Rhodocyclales bacterium]
MNRLRALRLLPLTLAALLAVWAGFVRAQTLPPALAAELERAQVPLQAISLLVQPLEGGAPLLAVNDTVPRNPASVMKLVTTFAAYETFGAQHRWTSRLVARGHVLGQELVGDLVLRSDGDPYLTAERAWKLLRTARALGLQTIRGRLKLEADGLCIPPADPFAFDGDGFRPYNTPASAELVNFNTVIVQLQPSPDAGRVLATLHPPLAGVSLGNALKIEAGPCPADVVKRLETGVQEDAQGTAITLAGRYPASCGIRFLGLSPLPAERFASAMLEGIWRELGGRLLPADAPAPAASEWLVASDDSPTLTEIAYQMNKWSSNPIARQLLALVGAARSPEAPDHVAAGVQAVQALLGAEGIDRHGVVLENGAGLSRDERIAAADLARLLQTVWNRPYAAEFIATLPVAGVDGTARRRFKNVPIREWAHVKTGTLRDVRAIAGFAQSRSGRRYLIVAFVEHENAAQAGDVLTALFDWLWER